jgi:hypothetical protein
VLAQVRRLLGRIPLERFRIVYTQRIHVKDAARLAPGGGNDRRRWIMMDVRRPRWRAVSARSGSIRGGGFAAELPDMHRALQLVHVL